MKKNNNKIKNLKFDGKSISRLASYGTVTLVSIGLAGVIGSTMLPSDPEYPEYVIIQGPWEDQSEDENSYQYVRNSEYFDLDENSYVLLDSYKNDVDTLEVLLGNPDTFTTEVYLDKLSDKEKNEGKRLIYPKEYSKKDKYNLIWKSLSLIALLGITFTGASAFRDEIDKAKTYKKF